MNGADCDFAGDATVTWVSLYPEQIESLLRGDVVRVDIKPKADDALPTIVVIRQKFGVRPTRGRPCPTKAGPDGDGPPAEHGADPGGRAPGSAGG